MLHSLLFLEYPGPFVCGPFDSVRHTAENDLRDLPVSLFPAHTVQAYLP